ncbi:recombinase family protein [Roseomonas chloroacetimidivorans]|uniref:recombinase family protein n=1 Tax=Roseomonas chloroacetimidivorans TaxID=1766656 RepID=UPI003C713BD9
MTSELVTARHLGRKAVIYIRQSTPQQVMTNQESLRLQYALRRRAQELGWHEGDIEVIDTDLGRSGASAAHREGFKDLIARVTLGEVGLVLSYEVTRLARNCSDWYPLLDLCGYRQCLIGDRDGVYDPGSANGRLLLGLKGTISEVELHTLRGRLTAGLLSKAERGELALLLPAGLTRGAHGVVTKHPDREVQERISLVFTSFLELGSVGKVLRAFRGRRLAVPRLDRFGEVVWRTPTGGMIAAILKNPAYCGAFVYGRTRSCRATYAGGKLITARCPMTEWKVVVRDRYPAYIGWEEFERIRAMLRDNHAEYMRHQTRGVPREGAALLQGCVWCGRCGHKMTVEYRSRTRYVCNFLQRSQGGPLCQHLPADPIDEQVVAAFFAAVGPEELDAWARAQEARRQAEDALDHAEAQQVERLRYQALLAERQFSRVDPDNRLVASELEHRWEAALRELRQAEEALALRRASRTEPETLTSEERADFLALGPQLPAIWHQPSMDRTHKKAMLRCLIDKVILQRTVPERIDIRIVWRGGDVAEAQVEPAVYALHALSRGPEMQARMLELAHQDFPDAEVADILTREGHRSPRCSRVLARTVQVFRQRHRVLRGTSRTHPRHIPGSLSIAELARRLQVSRSWVDRCIRSGAIVIVRDAAAKRYLFPDTEDSLAALQSLKSGQVTHVDLVRNDQEQMRAST